MSQSFTLVATSRRSATVLKTLGDTDLAWAGGIPIAFLALFEPEDIVVLPWDASIRQLTLFAPRDAALTRLAARAEHVARCLAEDAARIADEQGSGPLPSAAALRDALASFAEHIAKSPGTHVQLFLDDSYIPWHEHARAELAKLLRAADGDNDGWGDFTFLSGGLADASDADVRRVLIGNPDTGTPSRDALAAFLEEGSHPLLGTLTIVLEAVARSAGRVGRLASFADVLGGLSLAIDEGEALHVELDDGRVVGARAPSDEIVAGIPRSSLPPLARVDANTLFGALGDLWTLADDGAFADGPLRCVGVTLRAGTLPPAVALQAEDAPLEPISLPAIESSPDDALWGTFGAMPIEQRAAFFAGLSTAERIGLYGAHRKYGARDDGDNLIEDHVETDAEAQLHWLTVRSFDETMLAVAMEHADPRARIGLVDEWEYILRPDVATWSRLLRDPCAAVRAAAAKSSDCPERLPAVERHAGVRAVSPKAHAWELMMLATHGDPTVRLNVARNAYTPARVHIALAADADARVRCATVFALAAAALYGRRDAAAADAVLRLAGDPEVAVRAEVVAGLAHAGGDWLKDHAKLRGALKDLLADPDPGVAARARAVLDADAH